MIRWTCLALALLGLLACAAFAQEYTAPRVPLGILVTNWDCDPCAPANQTLDAWYDGTDGRYALIRVHCWWPGPDDPIYAANVAQSEYLIWDTPNGPDSAPHLWVDNIVNGGIYADQMVGYLEDRAREAAPLVIELGWNEVAEELSVTIDVVNEMPAAVYRLFVAVTEDSVAAQGTNGEPYHNQAFRRLYPDTIGVAVANELGEQVRTVDVPLGHPWQRDQLRVVAFVQDRDTGEVMNAATVKLPTTATPAPEAPAVTALQISAYPNPFNPLTRIGYELPAEGAVRVRVHDLAGRIVRTLVDASRPAGSHEVIWRGRDELGRVMPSGLYLVQVRTATATASTKLMLAR